MIVVVVVICVIVFVIVIVIVMTVGVIAVGRWIPLLFILPAEKGVTFCFASFFKDKSENWKGWTV